MGGVTLTNFRIVTHFVLAPKNLVLLFGHDMYCFVSELIILVSFVDFLSRYLVKFQPNINLNQFCGNLHD